jgi:hypothetical protein
LDETKQLVTKPTGGGRGSRERRRRRRQQQRIQQQQSQQHEQQQHSGRDQRQLLLQPRIHNIPMGRTRPETVSARQESNNNQQHLMKLLKEKMQDMDAEINSVKEENKNMIKDTKQLRCTVKRIREVKEKPVFCWHCMLYTSAIHFCINKRKWINVDRINRIIIYADNENGATPKHANDKNEHFQVVLMQKFSIDNREEIIIDKKAEEAKREKHEREAQDTQELSWMMGKIFGEFQTHNI